MARLKDILYVEDDPDMAELTIMTLQDLGGFEVRHCCSGQEALTALKGHIPQLVLTDVMMPGMDGTEMLSKMQQMTECENVPVIFMTAKAQTHEQKAYLDLGAIGVILKPFDPLELSFTLNELWQKAERASAEA